MGIISGTVFRMKLRMLISRANLYAMSNSVIKQMNLATSHGNEYQKDQ
jgi:hypothetical protein